MANEAQVDLKPLWAEILKIYAAFRQICERHGLRFFAAYGTAIGAVRHHGFIPWDDDFDVIMPYSDYKTFLGIARKELPCNMRIVTGVNSNSPCFGYGKIHNVDRETLLRVENESGTHLPQGIYIDIFPLCGIPRQTILLRLKLLYYRFRQYGLQKRQFGSILGRIVHAMGRFLLLFPGPRSFMELAVAKRKASELLPFDVAERVAVFNWTTFKFLPPAPQHDGTRYLKAEWFRGGRLIPFENTDIPIPIGFDEMLTAHYGDYMKLPPIEDRIAKHERENIAPWRFGDILDVDP